MTAPQIVITVLAVVLQFLDRLVDVGERLVLALLRFISPSTSSGFQRLHQLLQRRDVEVAVEEDRLRASASSARGSGGPGRSSCRTSARRLAGTCWREELDASRCSTVASSSVEAFDLVDQAGLARAPSGSRSPSPASTSSGWCTTSTGPSAIRLQLRIGDQQRDLDDAVGVGHAGPVISMSIQIEVVCVIVRRSHARILSLASNAATPFTWLFLAALAAATGTRLWLAARQVRHVRAHRDAVPASFAGAIPLAAHQKAADYTVAKARLGDGSMPCSTRRCCWRSPSAARLQWLLDAWARRRRRRSASRTASR